LSFLPPDPRALFCYIVVRLTFAARGPFGAVGNLELDSITLAQICDALAIDTALVKEVFLPRLTLDEPKAFVHSQRPNCPHHLPISDLWFLTIAVEFNSNDGMTCLVDLTRRRAPVAE
jgi:hypothetical protein